MARSNQAKTLSFAQLQALWKELPPHWAVLAATCYFCGSRVGEAMALTREAIDFKTNTITFHKHTTKTKQPRTVLIHPELKRILLTWPDLPSSGQLWTQTQRAYTKQLKRAADWLGYGDDTKSHSMRRSAITAMAAGGATISEIHSVTGQAYSTIQRYVDHNPRMQQKALQKLFNNL